MEWSIQLPFVLLALVTAPYTHAAEPTSGESGSSIGKGSATENGESARPNVGDKAVDVTERDVPRPKPEGKTAEPTNRAGVRPKPEDRPGFSGSLSVGGMYAIARTNMVSSAGFGLVTIGQASLISLHAEPRKLDGVLPIVTLTLRYNFAATGTQILFGIWSHGDALQFESFNQGGVGQQIGRAGKLSLAFLYGLPVRVWSDPYVTGAARHDTRRNQVGARSSWEGVFGSALQMHYVYRHLTIDNEASGVFLGLGPSDSAVLRRAGDVHQGEISYPFTVARAFKFTPAFSYARESLQGAAMSANKFDVRLRSAFGTRPLSIVVDGFIGRSLYDHTNPIFGTTQADRRFAVSGTVLVRKPFGWAPYGYGGVSLFATVLYHASVSNIDFYSASLLGLGGGLAMQF